MIGLKRNVRIRTVCADSDGMISSCMDIGIELQYLISIDALTKEFTINQKDMAAVNEMLNKYSGSLRIVESNDLLLVILQIFKRPILLCGTILFAVLLACTYGRIFFIKVSGNHQIPTEAILAKAQMYGLEFGAKAEDIRSEEFKNTILSDFPQLQWLGITTSGSVANIQVTERSIPETNDNDNRSYWGIYASRDGVVSRMTVEKGTTLIQLGQQVKKGDLLVSGYTDCGIKIRAEQPVGEIFAYTRRSFTAYAPKKTPMRGKITGNHSCYKLRIGKKVINLCNHSGNRDTLCVKMYEEKYCTLPGGFQLPLSVIRVKYQQYSVSVSEYLGDPDLWMPKYLRMYLQSQMVAGEVLDEEIVFTDSDHVHILTGSYACQEMIGQVMNEETFEHYAEDS